MSTSGPGRIMDSSPPPSAPLEPAPSSGLSGDDRVIEAHESFADDALGASLSRREANDKEAAKDRERAESARRLSHWMKVYQAHTAHFDRDEARRPTLPADQRHAAEQEALTAARGRAEVHADSSLAKQESVIARIMQELTTLIHELEGMERLAALEDHATRVLQLSAKIESLESQARSAFSLLLGGMFGFRLYKDPRLTFTRLFERIAKWPARIPPHRRPEAETDFDSFIAWVFAAPPCALQEDERLW